MIESMPCNTRLGPQKKRTELMEIECGTPHWAVAQSCYVTGIGGLIEYRTARSAGNTAEKDLSLLKRWKSLLR